MTINCYTLLELSCERSQGYVRVWKLWADVCTNHTLTRFAYLDPVLALAFLTPIAVVPTRAAMPALAFTETVRQRRFFFLRLTTETRADSADTSSVTDDVSYELEVLTLSLASRSMCAHHFSKRQACNSAWLEWARNKTKTVYWRHRYHCECLPFPVVVALLPESDVFLLSL